MSGRKRPHFHVCRVWVHARPAAGLVIATKPARFEVEGWWWLFHGFGFRFPFLCSAQGFPSPTALPGRRKAGMPSLIRLARTEPRVRPNLFAVSTSSDFPSNKSSASDQGALGGCISPSWICWAFFAAESRTSKIHVANFFCSYRDALTYPHFRSLGILSTMMASSCLSCCSCITI